MFMCVFLHLYYSLGRNEIGPEAVQHLVTVLEKMVQLKELE